MSCITGAIASLGSVALILLQIVVFALHRPPATAAEFVDLMTRNPMLGLVSLDLIYSVNNVLVALVYLALVVVLWRRARSTAAIVGLLVVLGMATYLASNPSVEMLLLAREYEAAPAADRSALLAAGEVLVAAWRGTAFLTYYILNGIALLLVGITLLRTPCARPFGRVVGGRGRGIDAHPLDLRHPRAGDVDSVAAALVRHVRSALPPPQRTGRQPSIVE